MSGSIANRDLRRAFGPNAIAVIDKHANAIGLAHNRIDGVVHELTTSKTDLQKNAAIVNRRVDALVAISMRDFWGRLTWLLTGR